MIGTVGTYREPAWVEAGRAKLEARAGHDIAGQQPEDDARIALEPVQ